MRLNNTQIIHDTVLLLTNGKIELDVETWLLNTANVALINDQEDIALFEDMGNGLVNGHYYFKSRGRQALIAGKNFLDEIFKEPYNINVIRGFTSLTNLGARWVNRRLGFTSHGVVKINDKPYELFLLHKKEFLNE